MGDGCPFLLPVKNIFLEVFSLTRVLWLCNGDKRQGLEDVYEDNAWCNIKQRFHFIASQEETVDLFNEYKSFETIQNPSFLYMYSRF